MDKCAVTGGHPYRSKRYWQKWLIRRVHWIGQNLNKELEYRIYFTLSENILKEMCWSSLCMLVLNFTDEDVCGVHECKGRLCNYCGRFDGRS